MNDRMEYWLKILGALALIKLASGLVKDAEKLIKTNMEARDPEIAVAADEHQVEWPDDVDLGGIDPIAAEQELTEGNRQFRHPTEQELTSEAEN